jgi:hypothetical protein
VKLKAVVTDGAPHPIVEALRTRRFATNFLVQVATEILGAENALERPAEFYVQIPDRTIYTGTGEGFGVELRLTGVSRNGRKASQFHKALAALHEIAKDEIVKALNSSPGLRVQLFTVLMLDGDIETSPGSGVYSSVLEHVAEWIVAVHTENPVTEKTHGI